MSADTDSLHQIRGLLCEYGLDTFHDQIISDLRDYEALLVKWNAAHNLIGPKELERLWPRHILDSLQLLPFLIGKKAHGKRSLRLVDFGSGAGFPALALAIALKSTGIEAMLVEANKKKASFLLSATTKLGLKAQIVNERLEDITSQLLETASYDFITARAFAGAEPLIDFAAPFMEAGAKGVFLMGEKLSQDSLTKAPFSLFKARLHDSISHEGSYILTIEKAP